MHSPYRSGIHLPIPLTRFIGREPERAAIRQLLSLNRLVTFTGPGGAGKTRLALELATELASSFADGVIFVDLAPLHDAELVPEAIARALGVQGTAVLPLLEQLELILCDRSLLIVLDNFEHLLPAAPLIPRVLQAAPRVTALVTSRARLRVRGERQFVVEPLGHPGDGTLPPEEVGRYPAVALFVERAQEGDPSFSLTEANAAAVAEICTQLDGLPLAIELAAARINLLPPEAIVGRLGTRLALLSSGPRDLPLHQQTLRDSIAWSYQLLTAEEQRLFYRLAVFVGGCTPELAGVVCGDAGGSVFDGLASLTETNLLRHERGRTGEPRFRLLETVREYALERLEASGEAESIRGRHAAAFHALACQAERKVFGPERETWSEALNAELDNLRAALQWGLTGGDFDLALDTAAALQYWFVSESLQEGRRWLEQLLASAASPTRARARALRTLGWLAWCQDDLSAASAPLAESVMLWRGRGEPEELVLALQQLAICSLDGADPAALAAANESLQLARKAESPFAAHFALNALGILASRRHDWVAARAAFTEAAEIARAQGATTFRAGHLGNLGVVEFLSGNDEDAAAQFTQTLALLRGAGDHANQWLITRALVNAGNLAVRRHDPNPAAACFGEAVALSHRLGSPGDLMRSIGGLGVVAFQRQHWQQAALLLGAADRLRAAYHLPDSDIRPGEAISPAEQAAADLRTILGEEAFAVVWSTGKAMSLSEAVAAAHVEATGAIAVAEAGPSLAQSNTSAVGAGTIGNHPAGLSDRELEVLRLVAAGRTSREIAEALVISRNTVDRHISNIFDRIGAANRTEAAIYAERHGLAG